MCGCTLANSMIVASDSVVCNYFQKNNTIISGNPARKIRTSDGFKHKECQSMKRKQARNAAENGEDWKFITRKYSSKKVCFVKRACTKGSIYK